MKIKGLGFLLLVLLASCGYRFDDRDDHAALQTINIPYVKGDIEGKLTSELIRTITETGQFHYVRGGGSLTLKVEIASDSTGKIGYAYDRKPKTGKLTKHLIPTEARREMVAKVSLVDEGTGEEIIPPTMVNAFSEFDFVGAHSIRDLSFVDFEGKRITVETYSLGQLDSVEGAQDDTGIPLFRHLSQKIVNGILQKL